MKRIYITILLGMGILLAGCDGYLDLKPDKSQVIPTTLQDAQALMSNSLLEALFPPAIEISSDDYVMDLAGFNSMQPENRQTCIWQADANVQYTNWSIPYKQDKLLAVNQALGILAKISPLTSQQADWNRTKGAALLYRAIIFFSLAQTFTLPYDAVTADQEMGIPLKLSPSISEPVSRGTLQATYDQILQDLEEALQLLPDIQPGDIPSRSVPRPVRAAAHALLARVYLSMGDYTNALTHADACLQRYSTLLDFKTLEANISAIPDYNAEVLYTYHGSGNIPFGNGRIAPEVYNLYQNGDLRKEVFFGPNINASFAFTGSYKPFSIFAGLATDEVYLMRAECRARAGNTDLAMMDLNLLRSKRWDNTYVPLTAANAEAALDLIIAERRIELLYRGLRWFDLRRLNKDPRYATTLTRVINGQTYTLPPNDLRYALPIPGEVLERVDLPQNRR